MAETLELLPPVQPFLFGDFAEEPKLISKAREFVHNGRRALRDDERCQAIVSAIINGAPKTAVMHHFRVGFETLTEVYRVFEEAGRVRTLKEQQATGWAGILVLGHRRIEEKLLENTMPAQVLPMLCGIAHDKIEGMTHCAGDEGGQKRAQVGDVAATIDQLRRLLRPANAGPTAGAGDSVSPAAAAEVVADAKPDASVGNVPIALATGLGGGSGPGGVAGVAVVAGAADLDVADRGLEGGGGIATTTPAISSMASAGKYLMGKRLFLALQARRTRIPDRVKFRLHKKTRLEDPTREKRAAACQPECPRVDAGSPRHAHWEQPGTRLPGAEQRGWAGL